MLVSVLCLVLAWFTRQFTIEITGDVLSFGFGGLRKRIKLSDISGTSITEASLMTTGIGIHYIPGRCWAWVARCGPALKITMASGSVASYIISTGRPRDLAAAIAGISNPEPMRRL
jgi:hypothetical protein